tara:strand:+ start:697 stop:1077 length:381 start_codon:yes stop_codon:yes gene_type:complete
MMKKKLYVIYAIEKLYPDLVGGYIDKTDDFNWSNLKFENGDLGDLDQSLIETELEKIYISKAYQQLRRERDNLLSKSDWMSFSDSPTMSAEWQTYRQALRDLPANSTPNLDENGNLTGVEWPTKPE